MLNPQSIGQRIAAIRKQVGDTQQAFAERLTVTPQSVSKWENGQSLPQLDKLLSIAWLGQTTIDALLDDLHAANAVPGVDRGLHQIMPYLLCPQCGQKLTLCAADASHLHYTCTQGHRLSVIDGVIDCGTREMPGELWSLYLKNFDHYLREHDLNHQNPAYKRGKDIGQLFQQTVQALRPRTIVDIASGAGTCMEYILPNIQWPCTVIMTDLSHRILKYDKQYFDHFQVNPYVDLVCIACDCAQLPIRSATVDLVTSFGGFESMQTKKMDGFREAHRILKSSGHAVYTMSLVEDKANAKRWLNLLNPSPDPHDDLWASCTMTLEKWQAISTSQGYVSMKETLIYDEMPAPSHGPFPFENEIMQWMGKTFINAIKS